MVLYFYGSVDSDSNTAGYQLVFQTIIIIDAQFVWKQNRIRSPFRINLIENKQEALPKCWFIVGSQSTTMIQYWLNVFHFLEVVYDDWASNAYNTILKIYSHFIRTVTWVNFTNVVLMPGRHLSCQPSINTTLCERVRYLINN